MLIEGALFFVRRSARDHNPSAIRANVVCVFAESSPAGSKRHSPENAPVASSAPVTLNRAVVVAEQLGPTAGLATLDLHNRAGNAAEAKRDRERALAAAPSPNVEAVLRRRLTPPARALVLCSRRGRRR